MTGEVLDKFAQLITTALGLVAALAWNTAIQNLFNQLFGAAGGKLVGQFIYTALIQHYSKKLNLWTVASVLEET